MKIYVNYRESPFYIGLVLYIFAITVIRDAQIDKFIIFDKGRSLSFFFYLVEILLLLKIILSQYVISDIVKMIIIGGLLLYTSFTSGSNTLLIAGLFIFASKDIDIDKAVKLALVTSLTCIILVIVLHAFGIIDGVSAYSVYYSNGVSKYVLRNSLGFTHVNLLGTHLIAVLLCYIYLRFSKWNIIDYLVWGINSILIYITSFSRTAIIIIIASIVLSIITKQFLRSHREDVIKIIGVVVVIVAPIFSFVEGILLYGRSTVSIVLDAAFSGRFSDINKFYNEYGFSLLGQPIELRGTSQLTSLNRVRLILDNAYAHLAIRYGLILLLIIIICYLTLVIRNKELSININQVCAIIIIALWGIMETGYFMIEYNIILLLFSNILFSNNYYNSSVTKG